MKLPATLLFAASLLAAGPAFADSIYSPWANGPSTDPSFLMIGVWYQNTIPSTIAGYKAMGINTYTYIDPSSTQSDLNNLTAAGMNVVMPQTALGLANLNNKTIIGWFNGPDEPDNAQSNGSGGYTDPVLPQTMIDQYTAIKANDSTRPVQLDLGQGVAWNDWIGRGTRTDHPEDYPASTTFTWTDGQTYHQGYLAGSDVGAFDFYPFNATNSEVAGKISVLANGVNNLEAWSAPGHPVWNYIETTNTDDTDSSPGPTPTQVKAEVWTSLVHGSNGIIYFAHTITPFDSTALLTDPVMNPAVTAINAQVTAVAPELNSTTLHAGTITTGTAANIHIDFMTKHVGADDYLFTVADQSSNGVAEFTDPAMAGVDATVTVLGESRTLNMVNGTFTDAFSPYGVHLYELSNVSDFSPALVSAVPEPASLSLLGIGALVLLRRRRQI